MEIDKYLKTYFNRYPRFLDLLGVETIVPVMDSEEDDGGVCLKVKNEKFEGEVRIVLNFFDLFNVSLFRYDFTNTPVIETSNVHVDNLIPVIIDLVNRADKKEEILNESKIADLITEELKKSDIVDIIKKDKDFENRIKDIVRDIVKDMYRVLWQHNDIFRTLGK